MKCKRCMVECFPYGEYETVYKCPKCGELFTTKKGDEIQIIKMRR
jgi:ribosomal protein S27E